MRYPHGRSAMNCATTSQFFVNDRCLFRNGIISVLLVGMVLLGVVGCGEDLKTPEELKKEKAESSVSSLANEELLGSWKIVSIFGKTLEEHLEAFAEGGEAEETVKRFNYVFATDNSWTCNFASETDLNFPDIPPGKMETIATWSGTYAFDGLTLSIFTKESEVHIAPEPEDFLRVAFDLAIAEAEQDYDEDFRSDFIKPFAQSTCTKQGDTLVLITATGEEMVLEKQ